VLQVASLCYSGCNEYLVTLAVKHKESVVHGPLTIEEEGDALFETLQTFIHQFIITFQRTGVFHYTAVKTIKLATLNCLS
jgi:hypothetical protein